MMLRKLRISHRLMLFIPVMALALAVCLVLGLETFRRSLLDERQEMTKELVQVAISVAEHWHAKEQSEGLTPAQAQHMAAEELRPVRFGDGNYFFINRHDGFTVLNPSNPKLEGQTRLDGHDPDGVPHVRLQIEAAKAGGGWVRYRFARVGSPTPEPKMSYTLAFAPWQWTMGTGIYIDDVDAIYDRFLLIASAVTLVLMAIGGVVAVVLGRTISRPLTLITDRMSALTEGDLDVEVPFLGEPHELGRLARALESFKRSRRHAEALSEAQAAEQAAKARRQEALERTVDEFNQHATLVVEAVARAAEGVQTHAQRLAEMAAHSRTGTEAAGRAALDTSGNVQAVAGAAEQLSVAVEEVNRRVVDSTAVAKRAVAETERTDVTMRGLDTAAQRIGSIVQVIQSVASQTNLLALNATIEAARAGEHGKGFAVVAGEVKMLASQTTRATQEIQEQVAAIQGEAARAVAAIGLIGTIVEEMNQMATAIAAAMEQQGAAIRDIARNIAQAADRTSAMSDNVRMVGDAVETTSTSAGELQGSSDDLRDQAVRLEQDMRDFIDRLRAA